jgi:hypothetical protein
MVPGPQAKELVNKKSFGHLFVSRQWDEGVAEGEVALG